MISVTNRESLAREIGFDGLVVPEKIQRVLNYEIHASQQSGRAHRHCIALAGRGGTGKTSIGLALARSIDAEQMILVPSAPTRKEVEFICATIDDGTFLLLDEIHSYARQTWLLDLLEGARGLGRQVSFTAFGATTNKGQVPQTLLSRFPIRLDIDYTDDELERIAVAIAARYNITLSPDDMTVLLRASVGNPRTMRTILGFWGAGGPEDAVELAMLTTDGLDNDAIRVLEYLSEHKRSIGRDMLARVMDAPGGLEDTVSLLTARRYIELKPQGVCISSAGIRRVQINRKTGR